MADFKIAQQKVKGHEGGYSSDKTDVGNWLAVNGKKFGWAAKEKGTGKIISPIGGELVFVGTNFGVAAPTLAAWEGRPVTADEMKALTYEKALKIFKNAYWDLPLRGDTIADQSIAEIIYDANIQHSPGGMSKILTEATGQKITIPIDAKEVAIINSFEPKQLFEKIKTARKNYYIGLKDSVHEKGWLKRLESYTYSGVQAVVEKGKEAVAAAKENPGTAVAGVAALFFFGWAVKKVLTKKTN